MQGKVVVQQETTPEITQIEGDGTYSVYLGLDDNKVVRYVGITKRDPQIRFLEHLNSETERVTLKYRVIRGTGHLTERQARIMEQTLINKYGMQKNDGALLNKINSISPKKWEKYGIK